MGFERGYEILTDGTRLSIYSDRFTLPGPGLFGGEPGATGSCDVLRGRERIAVRSKDSVALRRGDVVTIRLGGGGGYGDPATRPQALIDQDREDGLTRG